MRSAATTEPGAARDAPVSVLGVAKDDALLEQKQILSTPLLWFQIPQPLSPTPAATIPLVF